MGVQIGFHMCAVPFRKEKLAFLASKKIKVKKLKREDRLQCTVLDSFCNGGRRRKSSWCFSFRIFWVPFDFCLADQRVGITQAPHASRVCIKDKLHYVHQSRRIVGEWGESGTREKERRQQRWGSDECLVAAAARVFAAFAHFFFFLFVGVRRW